MATTTSASVCRHAATLGAAWILGRRFTASAASSLQAHAASTSLRATSFTSLTSFGGWGCRFSSSLPDHIELPMPSLSPTMTKGNLASWKKSVGEEIAAGDVVAEIETDKATMEMDSMEEGYLAAILVEAGTNDVDVGTPIAILVDSEEDVAKFEGYQPQGSPKPKEGADGAAAPPETPVSAEAAFDGARRDRIGPAVRKLATERQIDLETLAGTGPFGIITKGDVLSATPTPASKPTPPPAAAAAAAPTPAEAAEPGEYVDVPNTTVRKIIAKGLLDSKLNFPHAYVSQDVQLDSLLAFRKEMKGMGVTASVNDYVIRAVAMALKEVPMMNASWDDGGEGEVVVNGTVDVAVAVATDGGLITPVIYGADGKSVPQINAEMKSLAEKARANKLKPEEFQGGTFTISNLGMFGITDFTAIINPYGSQGAIMAVGGGQQKVALVDGEAKPVTILTVTLSADGRVHGGSTLASFLATFKLKMENPSSLFL